MPHLYLNSFKPLVLTKAGIEASEKFGLPPFIDGSIRREPDFEHPVPAITCLCRGSRFTPRLIPGDVVVYMTVLQRWRQPTRHHRVIALLKVERLTESHQEAADWYRSQRMPLPNNLIVAGNLAKPLEQSHRKHRGRKAADPAPGCGSCDGSKGRKRGCGATSHADWDRGYQARARRHGRVAICSLLRPVNLHWDAPVLTDDDLASVFGFVPHTRNPGKHDITHLQSLLEAMRAPVPPSSP